MNIFTVFVITDVYNLFLLDWAFLEKLLLAILHMQHLIKIPGHKTIQNVH